MAFVRFYRHKRNLILPVVKQAESGFYLDEKPVTVVDISDEERVRAELKVALARDNEIVPTPEASTDRGGSVVLEALDIRKWRAFEAEATMITIYVRDSAVEYYSTGMAVEGEWKAGRGKHISLPADTATEKIIDLVLCDLKQDLQAEQHKPVVGGLALLPPTEKDS